MLKKLRKGADKGFTLIELLIVVSLMGVLAAIVVFSVNNARQTAVIKSCVSSATTLAQALDQYKANVQSVTYPTPTSTAVQSSTLGVLAPSYLHSLPNIWVGTGSTAMGADYYLKVDTTNANQVTVNGYADSSTTSSPISGCTA